MSKKLKKSFFCECTNLIFVSSDTVSLEFSWPGPVPKAGQFFLIKPRRTAVFLGRPFSVAGWDSSKSDIGVLRFLVTRHGKGSRELVDIRPGEEAELLGPLGNFWPLDNIPADSQKEKNKSPVALISGGAGIAPLAFLAQDLGKMPFDIYAGFRTGFFGLENLKPRALIIVTEDGSQGVKGQVSDYFTPAGYSRVFACGPVPMLKLIADDCIAHGVSCYISVEKQMACGVGACLGCKVKTIHGSRNCCVDGPIFDAEEYIFDD